MLDVLMCRLFINAGLKRIAEQCVEPNQTIEIVYDALQALKDDVDGIELPQLASLMQSPPLLLSNGVDDDDNENAFTVVSTTKKTDKERRRQRRNGVGKLPPLTINLISHADHHRLELDDDEDSAAVDNNDKNWCSTTQAVQYCALFSDDSRIWDCRISSEECWKNNGMG